MIDLEQEAPTFWEPYSFKVGDRVRVRLSGECYWEENSRWPGSPFEPKHPDGEHGAAGVVLQIWSRELIPSGHIYAVDFDHGVLVDDDRFHHGGLFAAIELEPAE